MESEEKFITLAEVKKALKDEEKDRELAYEKRLALDHAMSFSSISPAKAKNIVKEVMDLERVTKVHAVKIADILPETPDEVRIIFQRDRFTLEKEEIEQILTIVADNR